VNDLIKTDWNCT